MMEVYGSGLAISLMEMTGTSIGCLMAMSRPPIGGQVNNNRRRRSLPPSNQGGSIQYTDPDQQPIQTASAPPPTVSTSLSSAFSTPAPTA
jgi:hypothetical protein